MIVIGNYDFRASGTVAKSIEIAAAAASAGLPVELWAIRADGPLLDRVPQNVPVYVVAKGASAPGRIADLVSNIPRLARAIRKRRPAVILSGGNHYHRVCGLAAQLSGIRSDIKLLLRASNSSQRPGRSFDETLKRVRRKFCGADMVVCVSDELREEIAAADLPSKVTTIVNGVDLERVGRMAAEPFDHPFLHHDAPVIVTMGRIARQKGFDTIVRAFARLREKGDARLLVIGSGAKKQRKALEALIVAEGLEADVDLLGYRANPFAILSRCDLFVSGSRWEGASNALIEALACGLPLVATDCPTGNREVVEQGPYGTVTKVDDVEGMAAAMRAELAAGRDRDALAQGARHWSIDRCLEAWTQLLADECRADAGRDG